MTLFQILLAALAVGSVITFFLYGIDKSRAQRGAWRISERTLLLTGLLIGAPGALLGMQLFRHKTRHTYFYAVNLLGLALQGAALVYVYLF